MSIIYQKKERLNMKTKNIFILSLVVLVMVGLVGQSNGGNREKIGTSGAQELLLPIGARGTALGGASLAYINGVEAIFWNPAGIANTGKKVEAMFAYMNYIADVNITNLAVATKLGFGSLAFSFQSIGFGEIEQTTEDAPDGTGIMFAPSYFTLSGSFSRTMTDRIYAGVTAKLVSEEIMGMRATGIAFDMGVQYMTSVGIKLGVALKNYGAGMRFSGSNSERLVELPGTEPQTPSHRLSFPTQKTEFPSTFEMAVSYETNLMENGRLTVMGTFRNNNFGNDEILSGAEFIFNDMFSLRGGYAYGSNQSKYAGKNDYIFGPTFGAGFRYNVTGTMNLVLDYAYRVTEFFSNNNIFTLKLEF